MRWQAKSRDAERIATGQIAIAPGPRLGGTVLRGAGLGHGYGARSLFRNLSFDLPPGAILGVLPAVALRRSSLAFGYFAGFCVATVATMGAFAAAYGEVTSRLGDAHGARLRQTLLRVSAGACLAVGVAWIALSASGRGAEPEAT